MEADLYQSGPYWFHQPADTFTDNSNGYSPEDSGPSIDIPEDGTALENAWKSFENPDGELLNPVEYDALHNEEFYPSFATNFNGQP